LSKIAAQAAAPPEVAKPDETGTMKSEAQQEWAARIAVSRRLDDGKQNDGGFDRDND